MAALYMARTKEENDALAKAISDYITANQDEVAQEENWRTKMQKEMARRFKQLQEENAAQREQIAKLEEKMVAMFEQVLAQTARA